MAARILVVEDDRHLASLLQRVLEGEGFSVSVVHDGAAGLSMAASGAYDLVVLDVMLPGMDGFCVCERLREAGSTVSILMLTVKNGIKDKVEGLERGADDYLTKPFEVEELLARIRALLRRSRNYKSVINLGRLTVDPIKRRVYLDGKRVDLSPKEFDILELLARNRGRVLGERVILEEVWGETRVKSSILKVYMHHLRQKLGDTKGTLIQTVRGVGYMLNVP